MLHYSKLFWAALSAVIVLSACSNDPKKEDLCADVVCETGECNPATGQCAAPPSCEEEGCLPGYECQADTCVATYPCEDDDECTRGFCQEGACVSADVCTADSDCLPNHACEDGTCVVDMCNEVVCDRGVCDVNTGACVNAAVCSRETQAVDCVEGFACYNQGCYDNREVCNALDCDRGVCDPAAFECIQAENCAGDDRNCLEGFYCNAEDQCQQNSCEADEVECDRGVCNPATGACENPEECVENDACTDGFYCIERACVPIGEACIDCPGNQVCEHQNSTLTVECAEHPGGCFTTLDCRGARECNDGTCGDAIACVPDAYEPNDDASNATDWSIAGPVAAASLCAGDADFYVFDTTRQDLFTGRLSAVVTISRYDVGVGAVELELLDAAGNVVASTTSQPSDRTLAVDFQITTINRGIYTIAVKSAASSVGGIEYSIAISLLDAAAAEMCDNAAELTATVNGNTSLSTTNALSSSCVTTPVGNDEAWTFELDEPAAVTIALSGNTFDAVLSLRAVCAQDSTEISCVDNATASGDETLRATLDAGRYVVVVQGASSSDAGAYTLQLSRDPLVCTAVDNTCVNGTTSRQCNDTGTGFVNVNCEAGCNDATGACTRSEGDVCASAIDATNGYSRIISLNSLNPDYTPGVGCSSSALNAASTGDDAVFTVTLQPDEVVFATATRSSSLVSFSWYLQEGCSALSSCVAWEASAAATQSLSYHNATSSEQTYFLFLDTNTTSSASTLDVEILVGQRVCEPGVAVCNGATQSVCNAAGTDYVDTTCLFGCDAGACQLPPNDLCAGAIDASAGGTFTGNLDDYNNDYSPASSCTGYSAVGPDATYFIQGNAGDVVTVTMSGNFDNSLYAVTDCADVTATCLDGSDVAGSSSNEVIQFVLPSTDPVFVVADAYGTFNSGPFTLTVDIATPDCATFNEAVTCLDATTLQWCDSIGFLQEHTCATTCSGAACDAPVGDYCFDAVPVLSGDTKTGSFGTLSNDLDPGVGTCILNTSHAQRGSDAVYAIDLFAGDLLTVDLTTTSSSAGMYVLSSCDARSSCERAATQSKKLQHFVETTGRYYVVVDTTSTSDTASFSVAFDVASGYVCQPGSGTCDAGVLTMCNHDGTNFGGVFMCANGCAVDDACAPSTVPADTCATAEPITASVRYFDTWTRYTNAFTLEAGNTCNVSTFNTAGADSVFEVSLQAGEVLDATISPTSTSGTPRLYIVTDCDDVNATCETASTTRVGYVATAAETVFLVVDNSSSFATGSYYLDIDLRPGACTPAIDSCADMNTRLWCDGFGEIQTETCYFGCTNGACDAPENDQCGATSIDVSAGGSWTFNIEDFANDYSPASSGCTGYSAAGPDATFVVSGAVGDIVTVTMDPDFDASLYAVTDCGNLNTCLDGSDVIGSSLETIEFVLQSTDPVYIIADAFSSSANGSFTLNVNVATPFCVPHAAQCDAGNLNIEVCSPNGTQYDVYDCDAAGCVDSHCVTQTGEYPAAAYDANALGQFTGTYADYNNDLTMTSSASCTGYAVAGPDVAYFVDMLSGERLTATLVGTGGDDTALYILGGLGDPAASCLVGADVYPTNETVSYTAPRDMRVYVIVDAYTATASNAYTLTLSKQ